MKAERILLSFLDNIRMGPKLLGSFILVIIILGIVAGIGYFNMKSINDGMTAMYDDRLVPIDQLGTANSDFYFIRGDLYKYELIPEERTALTTEMNNNIAEISKEMDAYRATSLNDNEKQWLPKFDSAWATYQTEITKYLQLVDQGKDKDAIALLAKGGTLSNARVAVDDALTQLQKINVDEAEKLNTQGDVTFAASELLIILATIFGIIIALVLGFTLSRSITVPLGKTGAMLKEMTLGHLGNRLKLERKDEIGDMARTMDIFADDLQNIVVGVMKKIAAGDLSLQITPKDNDDEIAPALRDTIASLNGLIEESQKISDSAIQGKLNVRGDTKKFAGGYMAIIEGMNQTLEAVEAPLNEAMRLAERYSKEDFSVRFNENLTVSGDFAKFRDSLNNLGAAIAQVVKLISNQVQDLAAGAEEANASAEEIAAGSAQVAKSAGAVSNNAETSDKGIIQILRAMEDLSTTVNDVAVKTESVSKLSVEADELSKRGAKLAGNAERGMMGITRSTGEINTIINDIRDQMEEIGKIVGLIGDIADQTNLLALNAAIEAARAGDAGLGFAVVANEVKSLAQESQKSAENIADIIGKLQKKSELAAQAMTTANKDVTEGGKAVSETLHIFNEIVSSVGSIASNVSEVASAAEEQAASVEEITASVNEVSSLVKNTAKESMDSAAASEEASAAIDQIVKVIGSVNEVVNKLTKETNKFTI